MVRLILFILCLQFAACSSTKKVQMGTRTSSIGGTAFYKKVAQMNWRQRDSLALQEIFAGNIPSFLKKFEKINLQIIDSTSGNLISAVCFVSPDYLSIGTNNDWARIPLTPMAAQQIADSFECFLPTRKIVDEIYKTAKVKLEPIPMFAFRDSSVTMWQHHLMIEGQRKMKKGLIAGIKKDVVLSDKLIDTTKQNRVAIYGWHQLNGKPIQPVYAGHVNWYVDYSHGVRLVYNKILVNGKWVDYRTVLADKKLRYLICDEAVCDCIRYNF